MRLRPPRWPATSMRVRLLGGLAVLLVLGMTAGSVASSLLFSRFVHNRYIDELQTSADGAQFEALLRKPLNIIGISDGPTIEFATGSAQDYAQQIRTRVLARPVGTVVRYEADDHDFEMIRIPTDQLTVTYNAEVAHPTALVLVVDTAVDHHTVTRLIARLGAIVFATLVLLLGLALIVIRIGMRPLARMAETADAIAGGARDERLPTTGAGNETDRLADAVNNAFDAQARAEATVRTFAADASHELRTPLAVMSGWLELHRQGALTGPALDTALEKIDDEVGRMRLLVEDLGLLARLDAGRPLDRDDVDLVALAAGVVEDAQIIYPDRAITLTSSGPAHVTGDAPRLQQVLRNLVGNAAQHTPAATPIEVEIATVGDAVELRVVDHGPGIPPDEVGKLFDRFWRAEASRSRAFGGSGLGLAIVHAIVGALDGQVGVQSDVGVGTTVTVMLTASSVSVGLREG
jgi:two-component system OmpR family sensor kinase